MCRTFSGAGTTGPSSNDDGAVYRAARRPSRRGPAGLSAAAHVLGLADSERTIKGSAERLAFDEPC